MAQVANGPPHNVLIPLMVALTALGQPRNVMATDLTLLSLWHHQAAEPNPSSFFLSKMLPLTCWQICLCHMETSSKGFSTGTSVQSNLLVNQRSSDSSSIFDYQNTSYFMVELVLVCSDDSTVDKQTIFHSHLLPGEKAQIPEGQSQTCC